MLIRHAPDLTEAHVTPKEAYLNRRSFLLGSAGAAIGAGLMSGSAGAAALSGAKSPYSTTDKPTSLDDITSYNNFYEFGTDKGDPAAYADKLTTSPWSMKVDGLVNKPATYALEDFVKPYALEERIYRHRCVEAWSMVIPWLGFQLSEVLKKAEPQGSAKYVAFETLVRPAEMPGQAAYFPALDWPYVEGLRLDEAMNPLTILAIGLYGQTMPNQNGAPIRLVVPWKYGFKGIKSIVRISLVDKQPPTSWNKENSNEYGFYSNVNPEVDHPRWSQASERRIGAGLLAGRQPTLMFNGYADQVASMYTGMDLKANF
ncbi:protein-methionine-sulfoxide reductase catalytic subunit MsrP [Labrys miyagiensis]|uniref:Protein-methionine-sulfoxide reductase catalytic subunit MsrP n=1 Tax=Labrys miyagiensis TaxID=346912 RepID=A0ABQ6CKS4_9HYPH|nr:protein-methionine-sulfoxide reductase catalytic subunit MsrP [Labrys miyagiensis]GLS20348.1 protein-methionine-sulfoxide reductase catalytic subunit MsrP [Labrys miyagiensis]